MEIEIVTSKRIKAAAGKILRRKSDGLIVGPEIDLGFTHYINGIKLEEPLMELPEHYEEIDKKAVEDGRIR